MEDAHSFIINIPVPKARAQSSTIDIKQPQRKLKTILSKKTQEYTKSFLKKYKIPQQRQLKVKKIEKDEILLPYRLYLKKQDRNQHKYELDIRINQKYKMKLCDYKNRLWVQSPPDDVIVVTDTDETFFKYANGRPLVDRSPIYKTLKSVLSHHLRARQEVGYRKDTIFNIELNKRHQMQAYEKSLELFVIQTKYLDSFVSEDYHKSMALVKRCEVVHSNVTKQSNDLQTLADKQFDIVSCLMSLDYMYCLQQRYGRFLYYLSPPSWRVQNRNFARSIEIEANGFGLDGGDDETFNEVFDKMRKECFSDLVSPALYFKQPDELIKLLEGIEKQQLHYLAYVTFLAPLIRQAKEECKALKNQIDQDTAHVKSTIKIFETLLDYNEERCAQLEIKFYKIINGLFYESVGAPQVIKLFCHLEYCCGQIFAETPLNMDIVALAKSLELCYLDYMKRLEEFKLDDVKKAMKKCLDTDREKFRRAKLAKKELTVFDRLEKGLRRAFAPPPSKESQLTESKAVEQVPQSFNKAWISKTCKKQCKDEACTTDATRDSLNDAQLEYLLLFTDWTHDEDPAKYLHPELNL